MIIATLINVVLRSERLTITVSFSDDATKLITKDFSWDLTTVADVTWADIKAAVDKVKVSLAVRQQKIIALKNRIGEVL